MFSIDRARALVALAVTAGALAVTASAGASNGVVTDNKDPDKLVHMADMGGQYSSAPARPAPDGIIAVLIGL
jgi:hypothetical protein